MVTRTSDRPFLIMGVINVTPDSFSDGGRHATVEAAGAAALKLLEDGADVIDFGAESTRPGARAVPLQVELDRLMPVLEKICRDVPGNKISIDSRKDEVFLAAAELGSRWFNRVGEPPKRQVLEQLAVLDDTKIVMTHMHGSPETMQATPLEPEAALRATASFFAAVDVQMTAAGFDRNRIWFDPGIGFGKNLGANLALLGEIRKWSEVRQVMVGVSRKSFIGRLFGITSPVERDGPGKALELMCAVAGAGIIRTHDVRGLAMIRQRMADDI